MKTFDWLSLMRQHGIAFVDRGANVKRGEINIKCPFCGSADPSHHLGLNLDTGWWACWRNNNHRGKSPIRLLMQLLQVPYWKARQLAGLDDDYVDPEGFDAVAARIMGRGEQLTRPEQVKTRREFLQFDRSFLEIDDRVRTRRFWNYLYAERGFAEADVEDVCDLYSLRAALDGRWKDRVVIPYFFNGELVTWTGRAIGRSEIRYLDLSINESLVPAKSVLLNYDCIPKGGKALVIVEGPLDMLKLDYYGRQYGVRAVALSTNTISDDQVFQLQDSVGQFDRYFSMLDTATPTGIVDSMRLKEELYFLPTLRAVATPAGRKDAGALTPNEVRRWCEQITR